MERVVTINVENAGRVTKTRDLLVVKELFEKFVEGHLEHLWRHFNLVDDQGLALVAEAKHEDGVVVFNRQW